MKTIFEYLTIRQQYDHGFKESIISEYQKNTLWSNILIRVWVNTFSLLLKPKKNNIKYYFWGHKYTEIILGLPKEEVCILGGPRQLSFSLKNNIPFMPVMNIWNLLFKYIKSPNDIYIEKLEKKLIVLSNKLTKYKHHTSILIVCNDSLPMQRYIINVAKVSTLKSICIQHGVFQSKSPAMILDGWYSDYFFAINDLQKQLLVHNGLSQTKIFTMGFYAAPYLPQRSLATIEKRKICFLGQPWSKYMNKQATKYIDIVEKVHTALNDSDISLYYKPHPWEDTDSIPNCITNIISENLNDTIENYDVFISVTSTALYEANWAGRISIQIYDNIFDTDKFSELSQIKAIEFNSNTFSIELLENIKSTEINIKKYSHPSELFLDTLKEVNA